MRRGPAVSFHPFATIARLEMMIFRFASIQADAARGVGFSQRKSTKRAMATKAVAKPIPLARFLRLGSTESITTLRIDLNSPAEALIVKVLIFSFVARSRRVGFRSD